jgi:penicillin-binding protein 1B
LSPTGPAVATKPRVRVRLPRSIFKQRGWKFYAIVCGGAFLLLLSIIFTYFYIGFSRMIDARLAGETERSDPRIFARPYEFRRGQSLSPTQIVDRLNDLGYSYKATAEQPGEFTVGRDAVVIVPRAGDKRGQPVRVVFAAKRGKAPEPTSIERLELVGTKKTTDRVTLDTPLITALVTEAREKRRDVPLAVIPPVMVQAVLAIEDRRFYDHPGIDPIGIMSAAIDNVFGRKKYLRSGSTVTQQLVKNTFLTPEQTLKRKVSEWFMSVALERRLTKEQILTLYLNDVSLGQRGSFAIHGVPEAARLFFSKDVTNLSLSEAATIAGVIQSPSRLSPFNNPERAKERRNVVLHAMADSGFISADAAERASKEPLQMAARALDAEAPYFVDYIGAELQEKYPKETGAIDVYTTLDLHMQRIAQDVVRDGLTHVDELLAKKKRQKAQAALIAIDPRSGEVLALVGGRSYNQSQYNRAIAAKRQPGSSFKPFVYLSAFERAAAEGRSDLTPATVVIDEPTSWEFNQQTWTPGNYDGEFEGPVTLRRALALSRNIPTIKVAETTGYDQVAALWKRVGAATPPRPYPSIALGVFEATPFEIATAYTLFANGGTIKPLHAISRLISSAGKDVALKIDAPRTIARPDTTFLVTNMMRSVLNEGTGAGARAAGFTQDAAGKSGTTNDLRDAWFVGFTPEVLTVVWVGLDDNQPVGLSGTQAALPIWTTFMMRALGGRTSSGFEAPEGVVFVDIDRDTGKVAVPGCPRVFHESFLAGTAPTEPCTLHSF